MNSVISANSTKSEDAQTRVHLKMINITLGFKV